MRFAQWWRRSAPWIHGGALFMAAMNWMNAILTLAAQLPSPDLVSSPQYREFSTTSHVAYLVLLLAVGFAAARSRTLGGCWMVVAVALLRSLDNVEPRINVINVGMWLTVLALDVPAAATIWLDARAALPRRKVRHAAIAP